MSYFKKSHPHKPQTAYDRKKEKDEIEAELELKEQEEDEEFLEEMYPELTLPHFWELSFEEIVQQDINPNGEEYYERLENEARQRRIRLEHDGDEDG